MSLLRNRSRTSALVAAPIAALAVVGLLAGCSTSSSAGDSSSASATTTTKDAALAKLLPASIQKSGEISFGALWQTPPVISVKTGDTKTPIGISPDLATAMAGILGVKATWQNLQWPAQLPGVESGNVDALFGQVSIAKAREQSVVDLIPYTQGSFSILLPAGNPKKITSLADACGTTIAAGVGSTLAAEITGDSTTYCTSKGKDAIKLANYPDATTAINALKAGNIDGWLNDTASQKAVVKSASTVFTSTQLPQSESVDYDPGIGGIAVSKSNPGLSKALVGALKKLVADGEYASILKKWDSSALAVPDDQIEINPLTHTAAGAKASS